MSPCSDRFFSGFSGFPLNLQTNTFKFQLDVKRASTFNPLFSTGATRKTVFQFLFIRIFRKLLVNGKQPKDSPVPDPEVGWGGGGCGPRAHPLDPPMFTLDSGFNFSGRAIKQNRSYFGFPHLRVRRKTNLVPQRSRIVTKLKRKNLL